MMSERDVDELIARGREVVGAMTEGPWHADLSISDHATYGVWSRPGQARIGLMDQGEEDAEGIVWLRNNASALLDAAERGREAEVENERHRKANLVRAVLDGYGPIDETISDLIHSESWDRIPWTVAERMVTEKKAAEARCVELEHQVETLRGALAWYAEPSNHGIIGVFNECGVQTDSRDPAYEDDYGGRARAVLGTETTKENPSSWDEWIVRSVLPAEEWTENEAFWFPIVCPDGEWNHDQIMLELNDYRVLMHNVAIAYDGVTFGRISKPMTEPGWVIAEVEDRIQRACDEAPREWLTDNRDELIEVAVEAMFDEQFTYCETCNGIGQDGNAHFWCSPCKGQGYVPDPEANAALRDDLDVSANAVLDAFLARARAALDGIDQGDKK